MSKYGKKHLCWSCDTKFYDFSKPEPRCPKCGSDPSAAPPVDPSASLNDFDDDDEDAALLASKIRDEEE